MASPDNSVITIKLNLVIEISLWQAIKLRIAGKHFKLIAEGLLNHIKDKLEKEVLCQR